MNEAQRARYDVEKDLNDLELYCEGNDCFDFDPSIAFQLTNKHKDSQAFEIFSDEDMDGICEKLPSDDEDCPDRHDLDVLKSLHDADFKDYSSRLINAKNEKKSYQFLRVPNCTGKMRLVKKSTVVWFCESNFKRLSNDRNFRIRGPIAYSPNRQTIIETVEAKEKVEIGNWAIFRTCPGSAIRGDKISERHLLGRVLGFAELNSAKKSKYEILQWVRGTSDEIGVICHWYRLIRERQSFTVSLRRHSIEWNRCLTKT
ncbi:hypothetical protein OUZ56_009464 [Daphnia magna]|uniref:Uncharacterized protein n=1 Tax=Daphnia magna TaxID=35525 RepID=A0ABR0AG15_9CRUS|nr:hypothetical protein OUZ56_009464 [Daphnia magna]